MTTTTTTADKAVGPHRICLLSTAYLGPVQYYTKLLTYPEVRMEAHEHYVRQTWRNRCLIAAPEGVQPLTVPVVKPEGEKCLIRDVRISDHGNWRRLHWHALEAAYGNSPFFEYYADDFLPFYTRRWDFLFDFNEEIRRTVCQLLDLQPNVVNTASYAAADGADDFRECISPRARRREVDAGFCPREYYQVFREKNGFLPNLSIADLLFNMGPEGLVVLRDSVRLPQNWGATGL